MLASCIMILQGRWGRIILHVTFWLLVFLLMTSIYAVQSTYWESFHNNLFYTPVHLIYYYVLAYVIIPKYLLAKKYDTFAIVLILWIFLITVINRIVGILIINPYMVKQLPVIDWSFQETDHYSFFSKLTHLESFVAAFRGVNMVIWIALGIKLFKMWHERRQSALEAELSALKAQVHPHFLFNTLNNLYALSLNNSPKSPEVILGLSDILRYMLYECNTEMVSLQKEVLMLQQYMSLEKLRYEDRLDVNLAISGVLQDKQIAPLLLLPFIENAFKHGASEKRGQAWINIDIAVTETSLRLKVSNGKPDDAIREEDRQIGHIGLQNVRKRLDLLYPSRHQLKIVDDESAFLIVLDVDLQGEPVSVKKLISV